MYEATFELETLTPLFMRGADQSKAEFRSASVKGAMRWWFRALAGNYFGDNITELREAECRVFGCAGSGETRRSAVIVEGYPLNKPVRLEVDNIRVFYHSKKREIVFGYNYTLRIKKRTSKQSNEPNWSNEDKQDNEVEFMNYLWFSIKMAVDEMLKEMLSDILRRNGVRNRFYSEIQANQILQRKMRITIDSLREKLTEEFNKNAPYYYPPGSKFKVTLKSHSLNYLKLAILSLWLAVTFGSFGFRARRGAGSMKITSLKGNTQEINDFINLLDIETVIKAVKHPENKDNENQSIPKNGPRSFLEGVLGKAPIKGQGETLYPLLRDIVILIREANSPEDALNLLEKSYAGKLIRPPNKQRPRYDGGVRFEFADRDSYNYSDFSHAIVSNFARGNFINTKNLMDERRFFFGLPLIYANWKVQMTAFKEAGAKKIEYERRASPVWLSVKEIGGKYYAMVVILPSKFLPDGYKLQLTKFNKNLELDPPAETLSRFLREVYREFINKGFQEVNTVFGTPGGEF